MVDNPEFALVLMYLRYVATKQVYRISTNGRTIFFDPDWLQKLSGNEMDYILSHQVLHLVRDDVKRPAFFAGDRYHHACDIIINSFMRQLGHRAEHYQHIGDLPHTTYYPECEGSILTPMEAFHAVPFDPASLKPGQRRAFRIDSDEWWGTHGMPDDCTLILYPGFKELSDEVIREEEDEGPDLKVKYAKHIFIQPSVSDDDQEEYEKYLNAHDFVEKDKEPDKDAEKRSPRSEDALPENTAIENVDGNDLNELDDAIDRLVHMIECMDAAYSKHAETMERILHGVSEAKIEWRKLLNLFLQDELHDYSFQPPDRRFDDSGFFLPDFNERDENIQNVLFMVDSSSSVNDDMISIVYGEISAAIEQFNGKMTGALGFFNTSVTPPVPFGSIRELLRIRPRGSGGTDFGCIFRYVQEHREKQPACIVIFTDGIGDYPPEEAAAGIPVLWILHGSAPFPSWGCTTRLSQ